MCSVRCAAASLSPRTMSIAYYDELGSVVNIRDGYFLLGKTGVKLSRSGRYSNSLVVFNMCSYVFIRQ